MADNKILSGDSGLLVSDDAIDIEARLNIPAVINLAGDVCEDIDKTVLLEGVKALESQTEVVDVPVKEQLVQETLSSGIAPCLSKKTRFYKIKQRFLSLPKRIQRIFLNTVYLEEEVELDNKKRLKLGLKPHCYQDILEVVKDYWAEGFVAPDNIINDKELYDLGLSKNAKKNKKNYHLKKKQTMKILERKSQLEKSMKIKDRYENSRIDYMTFGQMELKAKARKKREFRDKVMSEAFNKIECDHEFQHYGESKEVYDNITIDVPKSIDFRDKLTNHKIRLRADKDDIVLSEAREYKRDWETDEAYTKRLTEEFMIENGLATIIDGKFSEFPRNELSPEKKTVEVPKFMEEVKSRGFLQFVFHHFGIALDQMEKLSPFSNFVIYIYQLYTNNTGVVGIGAATWQFFDTIKGIDKKLALPHIEKIIADSADWISQIGFVRTEAAKVKWSDTLEDYGNIFMRMVGGRVMTALSKILLVATGLRFFPKNFAFNIYEYFGKPERMTLFGALDCLFQQFLILLRFGESISEGVPLDKLMESDNPTEDFLKRSRELLYFSDKTYQGLKVAGGKDHLEFIADCTALIALGNKIVKLAHPFSRWKELMKTELLKLGAAKFEAEKMMKTTRSAPICFTITGPPGIGKAKLVTWLVKLHCFIKGRVYKPGMLYPRVAADKFMSNLDPASQPYCHYPELGMETAEQAKVKMSEVMMEFLCVNDSNVFAPPMPGVDEKGKTFVRFDMVIVDCNNEYMNLAESVSAPAAQLRRCYNIQPIVQLKYRKSLKSGAMDEAKSLADTVTGEKLLLDKFDFKMKRYEPLSNTTWDEIPIMKGEEGDNIHSLLENVVKIMVEHIEGQDRLRTIDDHETAEMYVNQARARGKRIASDFMREELKDPVDPNMEVKATVVPPVSFSTVEYEDLMMSTCKNKPVYTGVDSNGETDDEDDWKEDIVKTEAKRFRDGTTLPNLKRHCPNSEEGILDDMLMCAMEGDCHICRDIMIDYMNAQFHWYGDDRSPQFQPKSPSNSDDEGKVYTEAKRWVYDLKSGRNIQIDDDDEPMYFRTHSWRDTYESTKDWTKQMLTNSLGLFNGYVALAAIKTSGRMGSGSSWHEKIFELFVMIALLFGVFAVDRIFFFLPVLLGIYLYIIHSVYVSNMIREIAISEVKKKMLDNSNRIAFLCDKTKSVNEFTSTYWRENSEWLTELTKKIVGATLLGGLVGYTAYKIFAAKPHKEKRKSYPTIVDENGDTDEEGCPLYDEKIKKHRENCCFTDCPHKDDETKYVQEPVVVPVPPACVVGCPYHGDRVSNAHLEVVPQRPMFDATYTYDSESKRAVFAEASTFTIGGQYKDMINEYEKAMECGYSMRKIPVKHDPGHYNVKFEYAEASVHKGTCESLARAIGTNQRIVFVDDKYTTFVLGIVGEIFMINEHVLNMDAEETLIRICTSGDNQMTLKDGIPIGKYKTIRVPKSDYVRVGPDQVLIRLRSQMVQDIRKHIAVDDYDFTDCNGYFKGQERRMHLTYEIDRIWNDDGSSIETGRMWHYLFPEHAVGDCGIPVFANKGGACVAGFHAGGMREWGFAVIFDRDRIQVGIDILRKRNGFTEVRSERAGMFAGLEDNASKSPFCHEHLPGVKNYGKLPGDVNANFKSKLKKSNFDDEFLQDVAILAGFKYKDKYHQPVMKPIRIDGVYTSPINIALKKMSSGRGYLNYNLLKRCTDELSNHLIDGLRAKGITSMTPATLMEAVNGVENDPTVRRINASTSGGFGFEGPKKGYMPLTDETTREPNAAVCLEVCRIFEAYSRDEASTFIYTAHYKDEARHIDKVAEGKTRLFYGSNLPSLIVSRMLLLPFQNAMVCHGDVFCTGVGVDMASEAALITKLRDFSPLIMEGDYGNYDQCMPFEIGLAASTVIRNVLKAFGYNNDAMRAVEGLLSDLLFPVVHFMKDIFQVAGLQPSGKFMTAEDNSLRGLLMLMYAFYSLVPTGEKFFECVLPWIYGDDVLCAVKSHVAHLFNNNTYKKFCEEVYLMPFTSASKSDKMDDFVDIDTCSFLKRNFRYREDIRQWVAPLAMDSIFRSLRWTMPSSHENPENQMKATIQSALWELALHLEKDQHDTVRIALQNGYAKYYVLGEMTVFPGFDEIIGRIWHASPSA